MGEADGPPVEATKHCVHGALEAIGIAERAGGVELLPGAGEGDAVANGDSVEFSEDEAKLLYSAKTSRDSAIGDEGDGFSVPLGAVGIDQGFQRGGVAVIVLRSDDDEGVAGGETLAESEAVRWAFGLRWIDVFDRKAWLSGDAGCGPLGDGVAEAAGAG